MRPVRSEYRAPAAVSCVWLAPGKFAAVNKLFAGSEVMRPKLIVGTMFWFFAQIVYCVNEPPIVKLCDPFNHVSVSSASVAVALRDDGDAPPPVGFGPVNSEPTVGKVRWNPPWFSAEPVNIPG